MRDRHRAPRPRDTADPDYVFSGGDARTPRSSFSASRKADLRGIGIASFGPVDLNPESWTYGYITSTPKPGWRNFDIAGAIRKSLDLPVGFDTDVNGAALGEVAMGRRTRPFRFSLPHRRNRNRRRRGGLGPRVARTDAPRDGPHPHPARSARGPVRGLLPVSSRLPGRARLRTRRIQARWGIPGSELAPDHPGIALEARYLALGLATWVCTLSPQRIVLGGGVMQQPRLFPMIRAGAAPAAERVHRSARNHRLRRPIRRAGGARRPRRRSRRARAGGRGRAAR